MERLLFIFSLLILETLSFAQQASIVAHPKSVNIAVNAKANFTCTAIAEEINWEVNGQPVDANLRSRGFDDEAVPLTLLNATQNLYSRTLSVLGSADNNGSNITCAAYILSPLSFNESEAAVLFVFEPGPVSNLTVVSINSTTVLISWSPPFTLEVIPILGYNVTITNTTSGENETMSVEEDTTMLYYSIDDPDPDNNFTVTVVPINGAEDPPDTTITFMFSYNIQVSTSSTLSTSAPLSIPTTGLVMTTTTTDVLSASMLVSTSLTNSAISTTSTLISATPSSTPIRTPTPLPFLIIGIAAGAVFICILCTICTTLLLVCCLVKRKKEKSQLTVEVLSLTEISSLQLQSPSPPAIPTESPPTDLDEPPRYATLDVFSHLVCKPEEEECAVSSSTGGDLTMSASHHEPSHISEEEVDGFTIIPTPSTEVSHVTVYEKQIELEEYVVVPSCQVADATKSLPGSTSTQTHYAELGFHKERPKAIVPRDKILYATISQATHERTYANAGDQKRQGPLYGVPTDDEREEVAQATKHKWRLIGLQLGVDVEYLDMVAKEHPDGNAQCSSFLFGQWARNELSGSDLPFMWLNVITILDGSLVRETNLAREFEKRINKN